MTKFLVAVAIPLFALALCVQPASARQSTIPAGAAVYIEQIDEALDMDFRAELERQKVALKMVASRDDAQIVILGVERTKDLNIKPQGGAIALRVGRRATVLVQDRTTGATLWSGAWEVRSYGPKELRK